MGRFANLVVAAFVMAVGHPATAADGPGAPPELIGQYGKTPLQCRSYHRKSDGITIISQSEYSSCGGSACASEILSHRMTPDGYVLRLRSGGNPDGWSERFKLTDDSFVEIVEGLGDGQDLTLVRCTNADAVAGIGLDANGGEGLTKALDGVFAAYYALAVPTACPKIELDRQTADAVLKAGESMWAKFLLDRKLKPFQSLAETMENQRLSAEYAVRADAEEIDGFCDEVLNVFGTGGRLLPGLLKDPRRGA